MYAAGTKLKVHYEGKLEDGSTFCSTYLQGNVPYEFHVGQAEILPALETRICTMNVGDKASFLIPAAQAYGAYDETLKERVPVKNIPHGIDLPLGEYVVFPTSQGPLRVKVESIEEGMVTFDYNHQLAGHDLAFTVNLIGALGKGSHIQQEKYYAGEEGGSCCHSHHGKQ